MQKPIQHSAEKQLLKNLRQTLLLISKQQYNVQEERTNELTINEIAMKDLRQRYLRQTNQHKEQITIYKKKILQLQVIKEKMEKDQNIKHKKEVRKYNQIIGQKDSQLQNFRNQITGYKNKIDNLECQVLSIKSQKQQIQLFVSKGLDQLNFDFNESSSTIEQVLLQKAVLQSKYQQIMVKLNGALKNVVQLQSNNARLNQKCQQTKNQKKKLQQKCLNLQFQIAQINNKYSFANFTQSLPQVHRRQFISTQKQQLILEEIAILSLNIQNIKNIQKQLFQIYELQKHTQNTLNKNINIVQQNFALRDELNEYKAQKDINLLDNLLKQSSSSLYDFFNKKKQEMAIFQQKLINLQSKLKEKDKIITTLLEEHNNLNKKQELQNLMDDQLKKLKQTLEQQNQNNLDVFKQNYQKYHQQSIKALQSKYDQLNFQNQKLKIYIDNLVQSKKKKEAIIQEIKKEAKKEVDFKNLQTQVKNLKNSLNIQLIKNKQFKNTIQLYKKQISSLIYPQVGKNKRTKKPNNRCSECLLLFNANALQQKCQKCKKNLHSVMCFGQHQCNKVELIEASKKKSTKSQVDYF